MDAFTPELSHYWLETSEDERHDAPQRDHRVAEDEEALSELSDRVYAARCVV
jgi:hypothetical protein